MVKLKQIITQFSEKLAEALLESLSECNTNSFESSIWLTKLQRSQNSSSSSSSQSYLKQLKLAFQISSPWVKLRCWHKLQFTQVRWDLIRVRSSSSSSFISISRWSSPLPAASSFDQLSFGLLVHSTVWFVVRMKNIRKMSPDNWLQCIEKGSRP